MSDTSDIECECTEQFIHRGCFLHANAGGGTVSQLDLSAWELLRNTQQSAVLDAYSIPGDIVGRAMACFFGVAFVAGVAAGVATGWELAVMTDAATFGGNISMGFVMFWEQFAVNKRQREFLAEAQKLGIATPPPLAEMRRRRKAGLPVFDA